MEKVEKMIAAGRIQQQQQQQQHIIIVVLVVNSPTLRFTGPHGISLLSRSLNVLSPPKTNHP